MSNQQLIPLKLENMFNQQLLTFNHKLNMFNHHIPLKQENMFNQQLPTSNHKLNMSNQQPLIPDQ